jgi:hypothetical protein
MSGLGGETLYGGLYSAVQGSFGGAYRPADFNSIINGMLSASQTPAACVVWDEHSNALQSASTYITTSEITMRVGELAKCNLSFVGQGISGGTAGSAASYTNTVPVFYDSCTTWGQASEFSVKIDRPYAADDYILSCSGSNFYSQSIYQSGETTVTGTIKLSQSAAIATGDPGSMTMTLGTTTISITEAVLSNIEMGISGRGLISKTKAWACPSDCITISGS